MERHARIIEGGTVWPVHGVQKALKRFAAYEDTGLEPPEDDNDA